MSLNIYEARGPVVCGRCGNPFPTHGTLDKHHDYLDRCLDPASRRMYLQVGRPGVPKGVMVWSFHNPDNPREKRDEPLPEGVLLNVARALRRRQPREAAA
jgi:hypothetical protein